MALHFELVSPEKLVLSQDVEMVILPGEEGDMGILEQHVPIISILRQGVVTLMEGGKVNGRIFVEGGFAEVTRESCIVLTEHAKPVEDLDRAEIERALADNKADIVAAKSDRERDKLMQLVKIAEAKLDAISRSIY